jgi:predicted O-methyltransferase YrrM
MISFARLNKIPAVDVLTGIFISFILQIFKPKVCLEIGCGIGVSMDYILQTPTIERYVALDTNKERLKKCEEKHKNEKIEFYNIDGEIFLRENHEKFDFVFVDSIKSKYTIMWHYIKKRIGKESLVIFDDVLLYGFLGQERTLIPDKYLNLYEELDAFVREIRYDTKYQSFILPIGNGLLMIKNVF